MSGLTLDTVLVMSPAVVSQELEGELVLLHLDRAEYFGLNATGTHVWNGIASGQSLGTIAEGVSQQFHIDRERARADVLALAESLLAAGLAHGPEAP